jgi:deoxycytidine triphosphate deaminase
MIVGNRILDLRLVKGASLDNLKHGTLDLTIGSIIPIGKEVESKKEQIAFEGACFLEPREMVWVLSKEEFTMPRNVTGLATLKTSFTKDGILALNVGIIDPMFAGPISTALINFSDRPRRIQIGDKFFRLIFLEHDDVSAFHREEESLDRTQYLNELRKKSYADFSPSFLNIPSFDDKYYAEKFWSIIFHGLLARWFMSITALLILAIFIWFQFTLGFYDFLAAKLQFVWGFLKPFHPG